MNKRILILSSGGDAPGMNAAIRAATRTAIAEGFSVFGTEMGFCGLMAEKIFPLTEKSVANCIQRGGTILKTARALEFHERTVRDRCRAFLKRENIDALVILGGNGSFQGAVLLYEEGGPPVIGIPCTIDNDIVGTEYTIGFDTACNTALQAIDKIRDTASSLDRHFIIEVMGRASGFLALEVGLAGGAEIILTPEFPMSVEKLVEKIQHRKRKKLSSIIVAAEACEPNHSITLAKEIQAQSGIEYKVCILGHTQRGGDPTVLDRCTATLMGAKAIQAILAGKTKQMLAVVNHQIVTVDFPSPEKATRYLSDQTLLALNEKISDT